MQSPNVPRTCVTGAGDIVTQVIARLKENISRNQFENLPYLNISDFRSVRSCFLKLAKGTVVDGKSTAYTKLIDRVNGFPKMTAVGSLHGDLYALMTIFKLNGIPSDNNPYVFLGNYSGEGSDSFYILFLLMCLKLVYPNHVFLLRGENEQYFERPLFRGNAWHKIADSSINEEIRDYAKKAAISPDVLNQELVELFDHMHAALVYMNYFVFVHGFIPGPSAKTFKELAQISAGTPKAGRIVHELVGNVENDAFDTKEAIPFARVGWDARKPFFNELFGRPVGKIISTKLTEQQQQFVTVAIGRDHATFTSNALKKYKFTSSALRKYIRSAFITITNKIEAVYFEDAGRLKAEHITKKLE